MPGMHVKPLEVAAAASSNLATAWSFPSAMGQKSNTAGREKRRFHGMSWMGYRCLPAGCVDIRYACAS